MKYFRLVLVLGIFMVASPEGFAAAKAYCPGDTAVLRYTVANVALSSGGSCGPITATGGYQSQTVAPNSDGRFSYTVLQNGGTFSLTCTNPGAAPETATDSIEISTSCSPPPPPPASDSCSYNSLEEGQLKWGAGNVCKAALDYNTGIVPNGGTATAPNDTTLAPNYTGFLKYKCNNGAWEPVESKCAPTCGAANGGTFSNPPTIGLCHSGDTASQAMLINSTPPFYSWNCSANGWIESCSANKSGSGDDDGDTPTPNPCPGNAQRLADGSCPTTSTCPAGTRRIANGSCVTDVGGTSGTGGCTGSNCPCTGSSCPSSSCGTAHNGFARSTPTASGLCSSSSTFFSDSLVTHAAGTPKYTWRCFNTSNESTPPSNCWAYEVVDGACSDPPHYLDCRAGASTNLRVNDNYWIWDCNGTGTGATNATDCRQARPSCIATSICSADGSDVINSCTGNITEHCSRGCLNGACETSSAASTVDFRVQPTLVRRGQPTWIYWNVTDALCTVTGNRQTWRSPTCDDAGPGRCGIGSPGNTNGNEWDCIADFNNETRTSCYWHEREPVYDALGTTIVSFTSGYTTTTGAQFSSGAEGRRSPASASAGILGHTEYNIHCVPLPGATGDAIDETKAVDIPAIWMED
ncbi:MAG: hypothetical protein Q7S01_02460 [bacterium]|nr:hypothetical protein [bacterium]